MIEKLLIAAALAGLLFYASRQTPAGLIGAPPMPAPPRGVSPVQQRGLTIVTPAVLGTTNYQITAIGAPSLAAYMTARQISDQLAGVLAVDVEFRSRYGLT
jgi:hypothetical protein